MDVERLALGEHGHFRKRESNRRTVNGRNAAERTPIASSSYIFRLAPLSGPASFGSGQSRRHREKGVNMAHHFSPAYKNTLLQQSLHDADMPVKTKPGR